MNRKQVAVQYFKQDFNCSQAIFAAYRRTHQLDEESALNLAAVFGAGVAGTGEQLCGAVTGGLLALSMKQGRGDLKSADAKTNTYALGRQFICEFKEKNGSCVCEQIVGYNIGIPENLQRARDSKLFETKCLNVVESAADILDKLL